MSEKARVGILLGVLVWANVQVHWSSHGQSMPLRKSFDQFPVQVAGWSGRDLPGMSEREKRVLGADDYLYRVYERGGIQLELFIAYYRSQESGDTLHSPKNCLPGAGWEPVAAEVVSIPRSSSHDSFEVNHYLIRKENLEQDVLYWYQASGRVFASEYWGKLCLVWDAITKNRTDGALIRVSAVRLGPGDTRLRAMKEFVRELYGALPGFLPKEAS